MRIHEDAYFAVESSSRDRLVRVIRSSVPFPSAPVAAEVLEGVARILERTDLRGSALLLDVRDGPGRNEPELERVLVSSQARLFARHPRRAMLMRTAVGAMQFRRMQRDFNGLPIEVFDDETKALAYLRGG